MSSLQRTYYPEGLERGIGSRGIGDLVARYRGYGPISIFNLDGLRRSLLLLVLGSLLALGRKWLDNETVDCSTDQELAR